MSDSNHPSDSQSVLIDPFGRRIDYVRVSVTDRCNYRCFYCIPEDGIEWETRKEFLDYEELTRMIAAFADLGVHRVRLTGGEPLVRRGLIEWAQDINQLPGIEDLSMSTNAQLLKQYASGMKKSGINRINVSLDSLKSDVFREITKTGDLSAVLAGIEAAQEVGIGPIKINMVVMKGVNDDEIEPMLDFAIERGLNLRFIETMPIGEAGLKGREYLYPADKILQRVRSHSGAELIPFTDSIGAGPARNYRFSTGSATVGVISAISRHFCETCNRVRLTARGELVLCLGQNDRVDLRAPLREGCSDDDLKALILSAIERKPERHQFEEDKQRVVLRHMSALGG